jgi:hypothetical protein
MQRNLERRAVNKLVGLKIKLDRLVDRERPCCRNVCTVTAAGELVCINCGQRRGWLSKSTAQWIEHVATRFGAPTTPIVVRKPHTNEEEAPPTEPTSH